MTGEIKLLLHTDTLFESILNDGFFAAILVVLFLSIVILVYKHFKRKK
jgi:hypothetical protein